ncbi:MAG: hypothetical protein K8H86_14725 [Ignavibacteriaceae bacterium]|nr:hypothetical protein [Ignavibacteriaceae bacterium]
MGTAVTFPVAMEMLIEIARTCYNISIDKTLLANLGVDADYFSAFQTEITEAEAFKTDSAIAKELEAVTKSKDAKRAGAYQWIKQAKFFIDKTFPKTAPQRNEFPADYSMWQYNESLLLYNTPTIIALVTKYNTELTAQKMPADFDAKGTTLMTELKAVDDAQEKAKEDNKNYTQRKLEAYKKVYDRVNEINRAGRMAYADDPVVVKYFDTPWPKNKKGNENPNPQRRNDINLMSTINIGINPGVNAVAVYRD